MSMHPIQKHIDRVRQLLDAASADLTKRGANHDASKLLPPEFELFDKYIALLPNVPYGSPTYNDMLVALEPALEHHYKHNRHHPQHFKDGLKAMALPDILEMILDWKAAGEQHDGCIYRSIEMNQKRFGYGDELKRIFINTAVYYDFKPKPIAPDEIYIGDRLITDADVKDNTIRFREAPCYGDTARIVIKLIGLDRTSDPAPGVSSVMNYNGWLPEHFRIESPD